MNLLNILLKALLGKSTLSALAKKTGLNAGNLKKLIPLALPLLLKHLTGNASSESGALSLLGALTQHSSTKALPEQIEEADETDGSKIIGHILGQDSSAAVESLAKQTGLTGAQVSKALGRLAPALLTTLNSAANSAKEQAKGKAKFDLSDGLDLGDVAALIGGGKNSSPLSLLGGLLGGKEEEEKDNALNGNDLLSSLLSFMK